MLILYLAQFLYMYIKDKKAVDRLKTFRTKSLSRLSSFNENEAADDKKKTRLAEAIEKKRLQLEKEIGNAQVWQFGGGCCGGLYRTGPGSWKGEALYKKNPPVSPLSGIGHLMWACIVPAYQARPR
jgi:hypothetical protein